MLTERFPEAVQRATDTWTDWNTNVQGWKTANEAAAAAAKKLADAAEQAAKQLYDAVKGLVKDAMKMTDVTEQDLKDTAAGKYKDKADEFRRRMMAVEKGTPPEQYGPEFAGKYQQLQGMFPGKSAGDLAGMFGDGIVKFA